MKYLYIFACFIVLSACAAKNNSSSVLQQESTSTDTSSENIETDNNIEKYIYQLEDRLYVISQKIMKYEAEISNAKSYKRMLRYIGYIFKEIDKSQAVISSYKKKSESKFYQQHILYVQCVYDATKSSYRYMESVIKSEQENQYIKYLDEFKSKLKNNAAAVFLKDVEQCNKINSIYTKNR